MVCNNKYVVKRLKLKDMAYRGETISITIKGDEKHNLDSLEFKVLIYPDRHTDNYIQFDKSALVKLATNHYSLSIEPSTTADLALGLYTIEILLIAGESSRSIYAKWGAFPVYDSASKNI